MIRRPIMYDMVDIKVNYGHWIWIIGITSMYLIIIFAILKLFGWL